MFRFLRRRIFGPHGKISSWLWDMENRIHCFRYGHPKWASWNIDNWFLDNIIELLEKFEYDGMSIPGWMIEDEASDEEHEDASRRWHRTLRMMRYGFKRYKAVHEDMVGFEELRASYGLPEPEFDFVKTDDGMFELARPKGDPETRKKFWDAWEEREGRARFALNRSLQLFKENFLDLWD